MKKLFSIFILLIFALCILTSCTSYEKNKKPTINEIPKQSIIYINFTLGNVIQEGKRAIFFNFVSDYTVTKMEIAGTLLDKDENVIHTFDASINFGASSYRPEFPLSIDANLVRCVKSVSFTKTKAYTTQSLNENSGEETNVYPHMLGVDIGNLYALGLALMITSGIN